MPSEAATDKSLIVKMVDKGMDVARINLSHDSEQTWTAMVRHLKEIEVTTGKRTTIFMDLAGPKIRTGKIVRVSKKGKNRDYLKIKKGNTLVLVKEEKAIDSAVHQNKYLAKNSVPVQLPKIIDALQIGEPVYFDDGMIKAIVTEKSADTVTVQIQDAFKTRLGSEKGINIPNTKLNLPSLTKRDLALLPFAINHADIIGYSFVRTPEDVATLYRHLDELGANDVGVVFKIENQEAFENLPLILLEGMKRKRIGVMIARGDLAVELGFERTSEVQNQILWLCEAAHVPVIWATQVLENLVKTGMATRAEISDAGLSTQAECVMLNKGPYIAEGIETLKHILIKMHAHYSKKKDSLRALHIAVQALEKLEKSVQG